MSCTVLACRLSYSMNGFMRLFFFFFLTPSRADRSSKTRNRHCVTTPQHTKHDLQTERRNWSSLKLSFFPTASVTGQWLCDSNSGNVSLSWPGPYVRLHAQGSPAEVQPVATIGHVTSTCRLFRQHFICMSGDVLQSHQARMACCTPCLCPFFLSLSSNGKSRS